MRGWKRPVAWTAAALAGLSCLAVATNGDARPRHPGARLIAVLTHADATRFGPKGGGLYVAPGVYLAATGGAFEIDAVRRRGRVSLWQVRRSGGRVERLVRIHPTRRVDLTQGVPDFFAATLRDTKGHRVGTASVPFCGSADNQPQRVSPTGPAEPTYPQQCGTGLTRGLVLGIDTGWAIPLNLSLPLPDSAPDGAYALTVKINPFYRKQLGLPVAQSTASVQLRVTTVQDGCDPRCPAARRRAARATTASAGSSTRPSIGPDATSLAGANGVPDLRALPAHDLSTHHEGARDFLDFGATIWNSGSGPLVLEGFRHGTRERMDATQFIYRHGHPAGSHHVGQLEFDKRKGHNHWHLEDVARYDLLDAHGRRIVVSGKQSFCLAPTDPIDLTVRGADWLTESSDLSSSCGGEEAVWLREVLAAGWGDTYYQDRAGQSFDITGRPNGRYEVRVTADPDHRLLESSYRNNVGLIAVELGGRPGARTVKIVR